MWWKSEVNFSFFLSLATRRMRSSAFDALSRSCARRAFCWPAFPLVPALGSAGSAAGHPALFVGFTATTAGADFPCSCVIGYGSSPSRCGPRWLRRPRSNVGSPRFRRDPFVRDVAIDPGRASAPRGAAHVAFDRTNSLGPYNVMSFVAHSHTPHDCYVRFASAVTDGRATLTARRPATALPGPDFHRLDPASLAWLTAQHIHPVTIRSAVRQSHSARERPVQ